MTSFKILFSFFSTLDKNILREMLICCTMIIHIFIFPCFSSDVALFILVSLFSNAVSTGCHILLHIQ